MWLWKRFPPFRLIRVPARFNIYASLFAAVLAAAGLEHLLARLPRPSLRAAAFAGFCALAVADLAMVPFTLITLPAMPASYARIFTNHPEASVLEIPLMGSNIAQPLPAICGYWQSRHRGRTSGGYSAFPNARFDTLMVHDSPFDAYAMARDDYLLDPENATFGLVADVRFLDYVWLLMSVNHFDTIVLHASEPFFTEDLHLDRLKPLLRHAQVFADSSTTVYDRSLMDPPHRPTLARGEGWRSSGWPGPIHHVAERDAVLPVYNPDGERPVVLTVEASAFLKPRRVRLVEGDREFASWRIVPGESRVYSSRPFHLPSGLHRLTLASDGVEKPTHSHEAASEGDMRPFSLHVTQISLRIEPGLQAVAQDAAEETKHRQ
jgi:hypothetical protein